MGCFIKINPRFRVLNQIIPRETDIKNEIAKYTFPETIQNLLIFRP